jgi:DNA repair protein RadC
MTASFAYQKRSQILNFDSAFESDREIKQKYAIHELPATERPRERLMQYGSDSLSAAELIAIVLGSGMRGKPVLQLAQEIISHFGDLHHLAEATVEEICHIKGMGMAKAIQLKAALSLGVKAAKQKITDKYYITKPQHAYQLVKDEMEREKRELLVVILKDSKAALIGYEVVAIGTMTNTLIHPREVFHPAVRRKASSMILVHNHPSGNPAPSSEDIEVTELLIQVGQILSIPVQDHLIIGADCYVSLRETTEIKFC